jgi:hypothetical protein
MSFSHRRNWRHLDVVASGYVFDNGPAPLGIGVGRSARGPDQSRPRTSSFKYAKASRVLSRFPKTDERTPFSTFVAYLTGIHRTADSG